VGETAVTGAAGLGTALGFWPWLRVATGVLELN